MHLTDAEKLLAALARHQVNYVLVGAMAMAVHGLVRATQDIAIVIQATAEDIAALRQSLHDVFGPDPDIDNIRESDLAGDYPVLQYVSPDSQFGIDIIARLGERFDYQSLEKETVERGAVPIQVASLRALLAMKQGSLRPHDQIDAQAIAARLRKE